MLALWALLFGLSLAQRPNNSSLCDYYAGKLYGDSNDVTQAKLIKSIVSLAFAGPGPGKVKDVGPDLTGILNPGSFRGQYIDLQGWFNGSKDSTNLNNAPVGIDWLDGGGKKPLFDFLTGANQGVVISNTTNQYRLFNHFFTAFSHVFGCSFPIKAPRTGETGGSQKLSLAYVHKYMDLNYTCLGHFINQFGESAAHFGFTEQDSQTFVTNFNSQYNVRCAPAITVNPARGPELLSLCQHESCPLAAPSPDCAAYANLQPGGYSASVSTIISTTTAPTQTLPTSISISASTSTNSEHGSSTSPSASQLSDSSSSKSIASTDNSGKLSAGAIAGIAISSAVVALMAIALALYYFKRRDPPRDHFVSSSALQSPRQTDAHGSYVSSQHSPPADPNHGDHWSAPPMMQVPIAEMETPNYGYSPENAAYDNRWKNLSSNRGPRG